MLDLIDKPRSGILQILDEQCIVDWGTERKFSLSLYSVCDKASQRFHASSAQRVRNKFAVEHYAGLVEYNTENWLDKNKDQLPAACAELLDSSDFELMGRIKVGDRLFAPHDADALSPFVTLILAVHISLFRNMFDRKGLKLRRNRLASNSPTR